jgi:hypothetical protein
MPLLEWNWLGSSVGGEGQSSVEQDCKWQPGGFSLRGGSFPKIKASAPERFRSRVDCARAGGTWGDNASGSYWLS